MDFLGFYNLLMALAVAGACGTSYNCDDGYAYRDPPSAYVADGGAASLPPAWTVIDRAPTTIDNGYNPAFYWNRPRDDDAEDDEDGDRNRRSAGRGHYRDRDAYVRHAANRRGHDSNDRDAE